MDGLSPNDVDLAPFPSRLLELVRPPKDEAPPRVPKNGNGRNVGPYVKAALQNAVKAVHDAPEGERNHTLNTRVFSLAGLVHTGEISELQIEQALLDAALDVDLPEPEARATIASAIKAGLANPREIPDRRPSKLDGAQESDTLDANDSNFVENAPLAMAELFLRERYTDKDGNLQLRRHRDQTFRFGGSSYETLSDESLAAQIYRVLETLWTIKIVSGNEVRVKLKPTSHMVGEVRKALPSRGCLLDERLEPPFWIGGRKEPDPSKLLVVRNGNLDMRSGELHRPTSDLFTTNSLPVVYDHDAPEPEVFLEFVGALWGDDRQSIETLQEWFGYTLTADTSQQKMLLMVGPKRSGKGTVARVLTALLGQQNVAGPTLSSLAQNFGLQGLIGKPLAIISDARLSGRSDQAAIVETLLRISGEDHLSVPRKHLADWEGTVPTRLMVLTNELPRLLDTSGALASRFIVLKLTRSFYGNEDPALTNRICAELPGILNWSIAGLDRLDQRGHFVQPEASTDAIRELEDLGSPMAAFVRERCGVGPDHCIEFTRLYEEWKKWCGENGRDHPGTVQSFGRDVHAAVPGLRTSKKRGANGDRYSLYEGIGLCEK